jgi:capsular exopolysaccharide synthesis family protein
LSRLYDILSSGSGEIADLVRPLVDAAPAQAPQAKMQPNGAEPSTPAQTEVPPAAVQPGDAGVQFRTVSLRIPGPSPLLPFDSGNHRPSEQYRILRTKIVQHPKQPRLIVVSSPAAGDGKSVTAINTAAALSLKSEAEVLLVDGDFRRSAIHGQLGIPEAPGLAETLSGTCALEDAVVRTREFPHLFVLAAGSLQGNPVELLDSAAWRALCAGLRERFRYVIVDSPPVGAVADYDLIQAACDGVILVIRPDHTDRTLCMKALETVPKAKFLGVLLNCVPEWSLARHAGADYYYYAGAKPYPREQ